MDASRSTSAMPDSSASNTKTTQRRKRPIWRIVLSFLGTSILASQLGLFSPLFSFWVYPRLVEPGWHNITPHGNNVLDDYVTSVDDPSLMFACGSSFSVLWHDPAPWRFGQLHFWRSMDSGIDWSYIVGPPTNGADQCGLSMPPGAQGAVFMTLTNSNRANSGATWVSHDAGASWRQIATTVTADSMPNNFYSLDSLTHRNGLLYGYHPNDGSPSSDSFAVSADNGATWTAIPASSSQLQREGWISAIDSSVVPDYRAAHAWFRVMVKSGKAPVLEHTMDDGRTWVSIGTIGSAPMMYLFLATTPLAPGHLCVAKEIGNEAQLSLLASADGGKTWEAGQMPASVHVTSDADDSLGDADLGVQIDANGACYQGFQYHQAQTAADDNRYDVLYLEPHHPVLQIIPLGDDENANPFDTTIILASNGLPARLIINSELPLHAWADLFARTADETDDSQILWTPLP